MICLAPSQLMLLFVSSSDSILYAYTIFRSSSLHTDQRHTFQQKYRVLHVCMCSEHMQHPCSFPLEGQCCECFTSSRLSRDAVGLLLPLEMPLAVTFSSCEWIINSRMRISQKFLCVILPLHDLCIRNAFRMVMSVRGTSLQIATEFMQYIPVRH